MEGGRLVGLLTETDALAALADILGPRARLELEWLIGPGGRRFRALGRDTRTSG